jgi:hypothetical protein
VGGGGRAAAGVTAGDVSAGIAGAAFGPALAAAVAERAAAAGLGAWSVAAAVATDADAAGTPAPAAARPDFKSASPAGPAGGGGGAENGGGGAGETVAVGAVVGAAVAAAAAVTLACVAGYALWRRRRAGAKIANLPAAAAADAALSFDPDAPGPARPGSSAQARGAAWEGDAEEGVVMAAHGAGETGAAVVGPRARGLERVGRARERLESLRALMGRFEEATGDRPPPGTASPLAPAPAPAPAGGWDAAGGEEAEEGGRPARAVLFRRPTTPAWRPPASRRAGPEPPADSEEPGDSGEPGLSPPPSPVPRSRYSAANTAAAAAGWAGRPGPSTPPDSDAPSDSETPRLPTLDTPTRPAERRRLAAAYKTPTMPSVMRHAAISRGGGRAAAGVGKDSAGFVGRRPGKALPTLALPLLPPPQEADASGQSTLPLDRLDTERLNSPLARRSAPRLALAGPGAPATRAWGGDPAHDTAGDTGSGSWDGEHSELVVPLSPIPRSRSHHDC